MLLKERFSENLSQSRVILPGRSLPPGVYNFTLTVKKGGDSDQASIRVTIVPGKVPIFELATIDTIVNSKEDVIVKGKILLVFSILSSNI